MNPLYSLASSSAFLLFCFATTHLHAQCDDDLACNFGEEVEPCIYFDTQLFTLDDWTYIDQLDFDACETGYAAWNDLPLPMMQDSVLGGPLYFELFDWVEETLLAFGYEELVNDVTTVEMSVCGNTLNYHATFGQYIFDFDGNGFINTIYGGYIAPATSFEEGCSDFGACNFNGCAAPYQLEGCEYLEPGQLSGDTVLMVGVPAVFQYDALTGSTLEWTSSCGDVIGEDFEATIDPELEGGCDICVVEFSADGCITDTTCLALTVAPFSNVPSLNSAWELMPNPTQNELRINWQGAASRCSIVGQQGQLVEELMLRPGIQTISVSHLTPGVYFVVAGQETPQRLVIIR